MTAFDYSNTVRSFRLSLTRQLRYGKARRRDFDVHQRLSQFQSSGG